MVEQINIIQTKTMANLHNSLQTVAIKSVERSVRRVARIKTNSSNRPRHHSHRTSNKSL